MRLKGRCCQITEGIFRTRWSPRVLSIFDAPRHKDIVYIGFESKERAQKFYDFVTKKRPDWKWYRFPVEESDIECDGKGITKPRRSQRLTEYAYEIKWHRPPLTFIEGLIRLDMGDNNGVLLLEQGYSVD